MKIRTLLSTLLILFCLNLAKAQSHKIGQANYNCKLNKKGWFFNSEKLSCPACEVTDKKEKAAKAAEDKRRNDVLVAKANADKLAKDADYKKEQVEHTEKNKVTEVAVTMPKSTSINANKPIKKGVVNNDNAILKVAGNGKRFKNDKEEIIFENNDWQSAYSIEDLSMTINAPKNFGIVDVGNGNDFGKFRADVINSKGEYLFNDQNIKFICHINDGWLLVGCFNSNIYYVYNLFTKKKINLTSISEYPSEFGRYKWGPAIDFFFPIFSDKIQLRKINYSTQLSGKASGSEWVKKHLLKTFPSQINEEILSKQSFVFVHTNYQASSLHTDAYYRFENELNGLNTLLLYCISKEGKLSTIKLK